MDNPRRIMLQSGAMQWTSTPLPASRYERHYGERLIPCFAQRPATVVEMLEAAVSGNPDGEAIICGSRSWNWEEAGAESARIAAGLAARSIGAGDRVALLLGNRAEFVLALFAILRLGAIAVPLSLRYQTPEIAYALNDCGAVLLIHEADLAARLPAPREIGAIRSRVAVGGEAASRLADAEPWPALAAAIPFSKPVPCGEDDTAVILYTSGTTGRPKGAMLTQLSLVNSALVYAYCCNLTRADRSIAAVPLAHVTGLVANILTTLACSGALVILDAFKAQAFLELAERERATHTVMVPAMYVLCLMAPDFDRRDLSAWRIGGFGGAPMPEPTIRQLAAKLPNLSLMNAYGATETSSPATVMPTSMTLSHLASVGLPAPNCHVIIVDEHGIEVPPGETGEIWIGGPSVVKGYWNRPEADRESFTGGYWHSGDIGMRDEEGFVYVLDRKKDMINRAGYKVYSAEVENVLLHHPGIIEAAVIGSPDPVLGERVKAFIRPRDPGLTAAGIREFCAARLADYKVPEFIELVDAALPRNANGKLQKALLRQPSG